MKLNNTLLKKYFSDLFLLSVFLYMALRIYVDAYLNDTMMTPDSCGYLREALNLIEGNGFRCDKIAGYDTWFSSWPIMYPFLIMLMTFTTKTSAYLASKLVNILVIGIILLLFRQRYKENAWIYSICLLNLGFITIARYTWSECTFILFLFAFTAIFSRIISAEQVGVKYYIGLGVMGICTFLTRYFGMYIWFVVGIYLLFLLVKFIRQREKPVLHKFVALTITAMVSGVLEIAYFAMNKRMSGMISGVDRGISPNEDYFKLTEGLAESLLTEVFHVFGIQISPLMVNIFYVFQFIIFLAIILYLGKFMKKYSERMLSAQVFCVTGIVYYVVFIIFRYFSSMDPFGYRFFEPATFIICVGVLEVVVSKFNMKEGYWYFGGCMLLIIISAGISICMYGFEEGENSYKANDVKYESAYSEVPKRSVVILRDSSEYDYWLLYYRPDIMQYSVTACSSKDEIYNRFGKSDHICIPLDLADEMLDSNVCCDDLKAWIESEIQEENGQKFVVLDIAQD